MNILLLLIFAALTVNGDAAIASTADRNLVVPNSEFYYNQIEFRLYQKRAQLESSVFVSFDKEGNPYPSLWYEFDDFIQALRPISIFGVGGGNFQTYFYIGQTDNSGAVHGLVNIAAFLAQASVISIKYDACDEFNIDRTDNTQKYAIANSCGQFGRSYQDEVCTSNDSAHMSCDVDEDIQMTAVTSLNEDKSPPPLSCRAKRSATDFTGHYDRSTGSLDVTFPFSNRSGRIDTSGCCWWGRGVLHTKGTCNFGRLNNFLGYKAGAQGYINFLDIDFCSYPEVVCEGDDSRNLRWSVGLFEWSDTVQTYRDTNSGSREYMKALDDFVQGGFVDVHGFIDLVGMALPYNCFEASCRAEELRVRDERRFVFQSILFNILEVPELLQGNFASTPAPVEKIMTTPNPTSQPTVAVINPPAEPSTTAVVVTPNPTEKPTLNPTFRPIEYSIPIPVDTRHPTSNPTQIPPPKMTDIIKLQPSSGVVCTISLIAPVFGVLLHYIFL